MSLTKIIIIVVVVGIVLFISLLYYTLKDKVNDVSEESTYKPLLNKPMTLAREIWLVKNYPPLAKFVPNFLSETADPLEDRTPLLYTLPKGTTFNIQKFKSVKNGTGGFTEIYAIGKVYVEGSKLEIGKVNVEGLKIEMDFEYIWPRGYSFLQSKYTGHGTPPWEPCPFDNDIQKQSLEELQKNFKDVQWDSTQGNAMVKISPSETLRVSVGGCLRCDWYVAFETTSDVKLEDEAFWNSKMNWALENVFSSERDRFHNALLSKKLEYDSAFSQTNKRTYLFVDAQSDTRNEYPGVSVSENGNVKKLEISWYRVQG